MPRKQLPFKSPSGQYTGKELPFKSPSTVYQGGKELPFKSPTGEYTPSNPNDEPGPFDYDNPVPEYQPPGTGVQTTGLPPLNFGEPPEPQDFTVSNTAEGKPVPIAYGRLMIQPTFLFAPRAYSSTLVSTWLVSIGEIDGFDEIFLTGFDGVALTGSTHGQVRVVTRPNGTKLADVVTWHGRNDQPVDAVIQTYEPTYADTNIYNLRGFNVGEAYLSIAQPSFNAEGPTVPTVVIRGLQCFDQRLSGGAGGTAYTTNPALFLADFITQPYGANETIDWDSVDVVANRCDNDIGGQPRWWGGVLLNTDQTVDQHIQRLRALAHCSIRVQGSTYYLDAYAPRASVYTFDVSNIVAGSMRPSYRDMQDQPTRVEVSYTTTEDDQGATLLPWNTNRRAVFDDGTQPGSTAQFSLLDAQSHEVAYRYAVELYRSKRFIPWTCRFTTRDWAANLYEGERVTVNHPNFLGAVDMTIERIETARDERNINYEATCVEYDEALFSDDDVADTPFGAPGAADPTAPPDLTGTVTVQEVIGPNRGLPGITSIARVQFLAQDWPFVARYSVVLLVAGARFELFASQRNPGETVTVDSPDLSALPINRNGSSCRAEVKIVSSIGDNESVNPAIGQTTILGKWQDPPGTSFIRTEIDPETGELYMEVREMGDVGGPCRYLFRASDDPTAGWDQAEKLHRGPRAEAFFRTNTYNKESITTYYVFCKTVDNVGRYSEKAARAQVIVDQSIDQAIARDFWPDDLNYEFQHMKTFTVFGFGIFTISTPDGPVNPQNAMTARFGTGGAWNNVTDPLYHHMDFLSVQDGFVRMLEGGNAYDTKSMRLANYNVEATETQAGILKYSQNIWHDASSVNRPGTQTHEIMEEYSFDLNYSPGGVPAWTTDDSVWLKWPVTIVARITPLLQSGVLSTQANNTDTIIFPQPYSVPPVIQGLFTSLGSSGRGVVANVVSLTATQMVVEYNVLSGSSSQALDLQWSVLGN